MATTPTPRRGARRKKQTQTILLVLLAPVFVLVWLPMLGSGKSAAAVATPGVATPGGDAPTAPPAAPIAESAAIAPTIGSPLAIAELGRRIVALSAPYEPRWARPETSSSALRPEAIEAPATSAESLPTDLVPSAILLAPGSAPVALVRGVPVRIGDVVDGFVLVAIHELHVQWRNGDRTLVAPLPTPALGGAR